MLMDCVAMGKQDRYLTPSLVRLRRHRLPFTVEPFDFQPFTFAGSSNYQFNTRTNFRMTNGLICSLPPLQLGTSETRCHPKISAQKNSPPVQQPKNLAVLCARCIVDSVNEAGKETHIDDFDHIPDHICAIIEKTGGPLNDVALLGTFGTSALFAQEVDKL